MKYKKYDLYQKIATAVAVASGILAYLSSGTTRYLLIAAAAVMLIAAMYIRMKYLICPDCGRALPYRSFGAEIKCTECGNRLYPEKEPGAQSGDEE